MDLRLSFFSFAFDEQQALRFGSKFLRQVPPALQNIIYRDVVDLVFFKTNIWIQCLSFMIRVNFFGLETHIAMRTEINLRAHSLSARKCAIEHEARRLAVTIVEAVGRDGVLQRVSRVRCAERARAPPAH